MVDFCPECSNLLRKKMMESVYYLVCKCGYQKDLPNCDREQIIKEIQKKKDTFKDNLIVIVSKEKILINPKTCKICPKCGYNEAVYWQEQLFSADEPMVSFFRCLKCSRVWREY